MEVKSYEKGDLTEAERLYRRAIALAEELSDVVGMSIWMVNLAMLCEDQGRLNEALPLLKWAMEIFERAGSPHAETVRLFLRRVHLQMQPGCTGWAARSVVTIEHVLEWGWGKLAR